MKKLLCGIMMVCFIFAAGAIGVFAGNKVFNHKNADAQYVDSNNDGVCDNFSSMKSSLGSNYIDYDNDGVCDNSSPQGCQGIRPHNGTGRQYGKHR